MWEKFVHRKELEHIYLLRKTDPYDNYIDKEGFSLLAGCDLVPDKNQILARALQRSDVTGMTPAQAADAYKELASKKFNERSGLSEKYAHLEEYHEAPLAAEYAAYYAVRPSIRSLAGMIYGKEKYQLTGESFKFTVAMDQIQTPHSVLVYKGIGYRDLPNFAAVAGLAQTLGNLLLTQLRSDLPDKNIEMSLRDNIPGFDMYTGQPEGDDVWSVTVSYNIYSLKQTKVLDDL